MSQREKPDRACKSKRQVGVSVRSYTFGFSDSSSNSDSLSGSERRSSAPSPVCPLLSKSLTDSLIVGESCSNLADISHLLLSSPVSEGDNTVVEGFAPVSSESVSDQLLSRGCNFAIESSDTDRTVSYNMSEDELNHDSRGAGNVTIPGAPGFDMKSMFREFFSEFSRSGILPDRSHESTVDADMSRQISALAPHKDGVDISKFICKLEADLADLGCPRRRWKTILLQKLQSKSASAIVAGLARDETDYSQLKDILIEGLGSSLTGLGIKLTSGFAVTTRSMNPLEKYVHLKSLMDSIGMQCGSIEEYSLFIACATYRASCSPAQRSLMDQREIHSFRELNKFALSINTSENERASQGGGRYNKFGNNSPRECFKCHKFGHRAFECRSYVTDTGGSFPHHNSGPLNGNTHGNNSSKPPGIVCFTCHEPGHKSPDCPTKKNPDTNNFESSKRAGVRRNHTYHTNWVSVSNGSPSVAGFVNGSKCKIVPDTGAEISVVPGCFVYGDQLTGEKVDVKGWDGRPVTLETAVVDFVIKGRSFSSRVAVAHADSLCGCVLFSIPMEQATAEQLLLDAASKSDLSGLRAGHLRDTRSVQPAAQVVAGSGDVVEEGSSLTPSTPVATPEELCEVRVVTRSQSKKVADQVVTEETVNVSEAEPQSLDDVSEFVRLSAIDMSYEPPTVGVGSDSSSASGVELLNGSDVDGDRVSLGGNAGSDGLGVLTPFSSTPLPSTETPSDPSSNSSSVDELQLASPVLSDGVAGLKSALEEDESLSKFKELGVKNLNGYSYRDGLLIHTILMNESPVSRVVVPTCFRSKLLVLAHDKTAHVGVRGMRSVLGKCFTWPGIHTDIVSFVKSCDVCLRVNSAGNRKSKMVERQIVCVPFESVCVDLVGPLPKGKRGAKYLFTYVCLASRWPDAIPMRTASATEAAQCLIEIISRNGIPLRVLSDRGTIFLSKLMTSVQEMLGIDAIATSPYRPQSNGVVERMHGTLKPMLSKAMDAGLDWVEFLPLALFALRQVPNRDLGFSPHCIVYGRDVYGPLDVLYKGWVDREFESINVDDWLLQLNDRLAVIHDLAVANQSVCSEKRALTFNL